jgi:hypothetical protein
MFYLIYTEFGFDVSETRLKGAANSPGLLSPFRGPRNIYFTYTDFILNNIGMPYI